MLLTISGLRRFLFLVTRALRASPLQQTSLPGQFVHNCVAVLKLQGQLIPANGIFSVAPRGGNITHDLMQLWTSRMIPQKSLTGTCRTLIFPLLTKQPDLCNAFLKAVAQWHILNHNSTR